MIGFLRSFYALALIVILSVTVLSLATAQAQQDPLFLPGVIYDTGGANPNAVVIADVNGDGKPDLIIANGPPNLDHGTVGVLLANGDGTFQPAVIYDAWNQEDYSASPQTIAVADINGDHKPDIVIGSQPSIYRFSVLFGNGDGTFQPLVGVGLNSGAFPVSLVLADVNGDGFLDVVAGSVCYSQDDCSTGAISVTLGNGDGTFQPTVSYRVASSGGSIAVAVADLNGDGKPDVAASVCVNGNCLDRGTGAVDVLLGRGDGTFNPSVTYNSVGNAGWSIAISDVNRDGKPDLVLAGGDNPGGSGGVLGLLLGNGDGTFQPAISLNPGTGRTRAVAAQDIDADGAPDLLVVPYYVFQDPITVLVGHGDGTFTPTALNELYPLETATSIIAGDLNGDGRPDIVVTAHPVYGGGLAVLLNNTGPHTPSTTTLVSDVNPIAPRQPVTYSAAVSGVTGGELAGTITFMDGSSTLAEVKLVNDQAAYTMTYKWNEPPRAHFITAKYSGDLYNASSISPTLTEYVGYFPVGSKTAVTTSGSPSRVGQPVTFTANVKPANAKYGAIPDGELVWFYDGASVLGSAALVSGRAEYTTSTLSAKSHAIKATYPGNAIFKPSSATVTQVVNKYATTAALTSSLNPSHHGQAVTFTATVTSSGPAPTGTVQFLDGTKTLRKVALSGGVATLTTSTLAVGTHPITAQYLGDAANDKSQSPVLNQVVQ
ncbi:MAG: FG-GAP-like repeat-containing protein [Terriglobales bacterium]|jgi:hypothetical protein